MEEKKRTHAAPKKKRGAKKLIIILAIVIALLAGAMIGAAVWGRNITQSNTNLPGVFVGNIDVSGLTREQTVEKLEKSGWEDSLEGIFVLNLPEDIALRLNVVRAGAVLTTEKAADAAIAYGHSEDIFDNLLKYISGKAKSVDVSGTMPVLKNEYLNMMLEKGARLFAQRTTGEEYVLDEENSQLVFKKGIGQLALDTDDILQKLTTAMYSGQREYTYVLPEQSVTMPDFDGLFDEMSAEPADAYYDRETDSVVDEVIGVHFDAAEAKKLWNDAALLDSVCVPVTVTVPEVRAEELSQLIFRDKLGGRTTTYWGSTGARINNIQLACSKLNGIILMPGESFSYNDVVGERTAEAGFQYAAAYNGDNVENQLGGGICQVSSTLYFTTLQADLEINSRTCHNFIVTYLPIGLDATVSWGGPEFIFTNNREYPIKIVTYTDYNKRSLTIEIWGTNLDGSYVEPVSGWTQTFDEVYTSVQIGWQAASFRCRYDANGNLIEKAFEDSSVYALHKEDINWPEGVDPNDPHKPVETPEEEDTGGESSGEEAPPA